MQAAHHCFTQISHSVNGLIYMAVVEVQEIELYINRKKKWHKQNAKQKQTTNSCTANRHRITKMYTQIMEIDLFLYSLEINPVPKVHSVVY